MQSVCSLTFSHYFDLCWLLLPVICNCNRVFCKTIVSLATGFDYLSCVHLPCARHTWCWLYWQHLHFKREQEKTFPSQRNKYVCSTIYHIFCVEQLWTRLFISLAEVMCEGITSNMCTFAKLLMKGGKSPFPCFVYIFVKCFSFLQ